MIFQSKHPNNKMTFHIKKEQYYSFDNQDKRTSIKKKKKKTCIFLCVLFVSFEKVPTFASAIEKQTMIRESKLQKCNNRMARSSIG